MMKVALAAVYGAFASYLETDFYPIIEYWQAGDFRANQLCGSAQSINVSSYPTRPLAGFYSLTQTIYGNAVAKPALQLLTNLKLSSNQNVFNSPFPDWACQAAVNQPTKSKFCEALGSFSRAVQCLTEYYYLDSAQVYQQLSQKNDFGFTQIPQTCIDRANGIARSNVLKLPLTQYATTPDVLGEEVATREAPVYYLLLKAIDHLDRFAEHEFIRAREEVSGRTVGRREAKVVDTSSVGIHNLFTNEDVFDEIIPGWQTERVFMMNEPRFMNGPTLRTPFGVMSSNDKDLLIVFRRPLTTYDARLALYNQQSFKYLYNFTGQVHDGSSTIFQTMSGVLEFAIESFYDRLLLQNIRGPLKITFAASYLPSSGGALILASHLQKVLAHKLGGAKNIQINVVIFGTFTVSDAAFVDKIKNTIEVRSLRVQGDAVDTFPCSKNWSCDEKDLLPRTGIETGKEFDYALLPGRTTMYLSALKSFDRKWSENYPYMQMAAISTCAYHCLLSQLVCPEDSDNRCTQQTCPSLVL